MHETEKLGTKPPCAAPRQPYEPLTPLKQQVNPSVYDNLKKEMAKKAADGRVERRRKTTTTTKDDDDER